VGEDSTPTAAAPEPGDDGGVRARQRLVLAGAMLVTGLVVGGVLLLGGSGGDDASAGAPEECVAAWNQDSVSRGIGSHVGSSHGYTGAWVMHLGEDFEPSSDDQGDCAVVFPAAQPDPEPFFAAAVLDGERWRALSRATEITAERLGELQREALALGNAQLLPDGSLAGL